MSWFPPSPNLVAALAVAAAGGYAACRFRLPGSSLIGAMMLTAFVGLTLLPMEPIGQPYQTFAQILVGAALGSSFDPEMLRRFARVGILATAVTLMTIVVGLTAGFVISQVVPIDHVTGMLSGAPGGTSEMAAAGLALGGDVRLIAAVHFVRQFAVILLAPLLVRLLLRRRRVVRALGGDERGPDLNTYQSLKGER